MPFRSKKQMRAAFGGYLGKEMKSKAKQWASETPNIKSLPMTAKKNKNRKAVAKSRLKKKIGRKILI